MIIGFGYIFLDKQNEYKVIINKSCKNKQMYEVVLDKSKIYVENKEKIDKLDNFLNKIIETKEFKGIIGKLEKILDEK